MDRFATGEASGAPARGRRLRVAALALLVAAPVAVDAQPAPPSVGRPPAEPDTSSPATAEREVEWLRLRAARIRDFTRGRLDPSIDPASLFTVDLGGSSLGEDPGAALSRILREVGGRGRGQRALPPDAGGDALAAARADFLNALAEYLRRPAAERLRLGRQHEERRQERDAAERVERARRAQLQALELASARLGAYLEGRLEPGVDPAPLLRVNLLEESEIGADPERRRRFLAPPAEGLAAAAATGGDASAPLEARLDLARSRMDELRRRFLSLSPAERASLEAKHRAGLGAREAAERARAAVERAAEEERGRREEALRQAETEAARLAAEEQMRLLSARTALAAAELELHELAGETEASRERALGWVRRARELEARAAHEANGEAEADAAYARLVAELTTVRAALAASLKELSTGRSRIPDPPPPPEVALDDPEVEEARAEIERKGRRLRANEEDMRWERVAAHRNAMVTMNQVRLRLFDRLSSGEREVLRGVGPEGIQQALREVTQIALELRFHRHALPRMVLARLDSARANPLPEILGLLELAAVLLVFRWWRRRADPFLRALQARIRERRPPSPVDRAGAALVWYLRRVHAPLEWLALVQVLARFPMVSSVPELSYLLLVLSWALVGWLVTKLLDAVAARHGSSEGTAALRWRSLRLAGITVVAAGLLLSVAERSVGRGALYGWITRAAWLAVLVVTGILVSWWRPTVLARIRARGSRGPLLEWVLGSRGLVTFPAAALGGSWLLGEGVARFLSRQAGEIAGGRRVLAWLFRREVERRKAARVERTPVGPLPEEALRALDPEEGPTVLVEAYGRQALRRVRELLAAGPGATVAVIAERGAGKTTFLERILDDPGAAGAVGVGCRAGGGFDALVADLCAACGLDGDPSIVKLTQTLRERRPPAVVVDDAQRIVRPVIGGLADVDRLLGLTRAVGTATSWVVAIGTPGYGYLERARGGRVTFDEVVRLDPWTFDETAELLRARTSAARLEPTFGELVMAGPAESVAEESRLERAERDFHALLWDYSGGNAAVALHLWRWSLGLRPASSEVVVRLPEAPRAEDLDDLAPSLFFVLRAVLQLELAAEHEVAHCTGLRVADVADALRAARVRGITESRGDRIRISLHWYRAVTQALRRRHLVTF